MDEENIVQQRVRTRREGTKNSKRKMQIDCVTKYILVQFVVCLILFGSAFAVKKISPKLFTELSSGFSIITAKSFTKDDALGVVKQVGAFIKTPVNGFSDDNNKSTTTTTSTTTSTTKEDKTDEKTTTTAKKETTTKAKSKGTTLANVLVATVVPAGGNDLPVNANANVPQGASLQKLTINQKICVPTHGWISSKFGVRVHPVTGENGFHCGYDIAANTGENIKAAYAGTVEKAEFNEINGNFVVLDHGNGIKTYYIHCSKLLVKAGDKVKQGKTIAKVGSTGRSTGPHLHFEVQVNGVSYDPSGILGVRNNAV